MATSTTPMLKITQVATGVAGSPYYLSAYFDSAGSNPQAAANAWRELLAPSSTTYAAPYTFLSITEALEIDPVSGDLLGTYPVTVAGLTMIGAGDPLPPATSLLLRWRTGQYSGGREIRGRTNIARLSEAENTAGAPVAGTLTTWQTRQTAFLATANVEHVIWSPKNGCWAYTATGSPWNQWAVLRSRRD